MCTGELGLTHQESSADMLVFHHCLLYITAHRKHMCHTMAVRKQSDNGPGPSLEVNNIRVKIYASTTPKRMTTSSMPC